MKAIVSTTYDDKYLFFLPIITWCWNKLGVDVLCLMPKIGYDQQKADLITKTLSKNTRYPYIELFDCPQNKESTYAQCSRLYASSILNDKNEILITSDIDMAVFALPPIDPACFSIRGSDLVPPNQYPICYISAKVSQWDKHVTKGRTAQQALDDLLGNIECENFRGNYWGKDQEEIYNSLNYARVDTWPRARPGTQFASHRCDRDDINWRAYLGPDLIDAHLWRPGYTDENFANIMELLQTQYPEDNFRWLIDYRQQYISLL